jgi:DNA-binding NarL/FixJ family response regulator
MKVLVIEDEKKVANSIKRGLEDEYTEVVTVHDGLNGLATATGHSFDEIILDGILIGKPRCPPDQFQAGNILQDIQIARLTQTGNHLIPVSPKAIVIERETGTAKTDPAAEQELVPDLGGRNQGFARNAPQLMQVPPSALFSIISTRAS